ncbi:lysM and putative peptidoglycan-binding domain-containing protein 2-like isoform X1 [Apostichopus japonicus]|uniref:lysM and putative peptidoglycan-binding domain-containing protein 2-like isoform X1 n=1 Tax=Stichopus japonicus TaxID=307972 RepID=UPI003AB6ED19|nr:LysM domain-containing protein-1 [Apostichopus japonicus]
MTSVNKGGETTRLGLGGSRKSYGRSYGSTQRSVKETFIPHNVTSTDTLQGIALKYGITVQALKRVNKLYTNDSIFLRTVLYIPVGEQPLPASVLENTVSSAHGSPLNRPSPKTVNGENDKEEEERKEEPEDKKESDPLDFLNKIDKQIKLRRDELKKVEMESRLSEVEDDMSKFSSPQMSQKDTRPSHISPTLGQKESYQLGSEVDVHPSPEVNRYKEPREGSTSPILGGRKRPIITERSWPV